MPALPHAGSWRVVIIGRLRIKTHWLPLVPLQVPSARASRHPGVVLLINARVWELSNTNKMLRYPMTKSLTMGDTLLSGEAGSWPGPSGQLAGSWPGAGGSRGRHLASAAEEDNDLDSSPPKRHAAGTVFVKSRRWQECGADGDLGEQPRRLQVWTLEKWTTALRTWRHASESLHVR